MTDGCERCVVSAPCTALTAQLTAGSRPLRRGGRARRRATRLAGGRRYRRRRRSSARCAEKARRPRRSRPSRRRCSPARSIPGIDPANAARPDARRLRHRRRQAGTLQRLDRRDVRPRRRRRVRGEARQPRHHLEVRRRRCARGTRREDRPRARAICAAAWRRTASGSSSRRRITRRSRPSCPVRKALAAQGIPTIFNLLGPLLNPARPPYQLVGIFSPVLLPKYAEALAVLGRAHAWAVHGSGMDELSLTGPSEVREVVARRRARVHRRSARTRSARSARSTTCAAAIARRMPRSSPRSSTAPSAARSATSCC